MKLKREFLKDLYRRRVFIIPYLHLFQINKELRNSLFKEYLDTKPQPDLDLYIDEFYSKEEIEEGHRESRERIPENQTGIAGFFQQTDFEIAFNEVKNEFYRLSAKKEIPDKYKTHSIEKTAIIERIKKEKIKDKIQDFNYYVVRNKDFNTKEYAEAFAKNLIHTLPNLNNDLLSKLILEDFIHNQNHIEEGYDFRFNNQIERDNSKRKYRELTMYANNIVNDYLSDLKIENPYLNKTPKIKCFFKFIEFLHSHINKFNQYNDLIIELNQLQNKRSELKPEENYKDKKQYGKIQTTIKSKFKVLQDNTANLIIDKAKELKVCNFNNSAIYSFNGIEIEIQLLKDNFSDADLPELIRHKEMYLEYRNKTHNGFLSLGRFFNDLDEMAKSLFDYFKDTDRNEFEELEPISVNSLEDLIKGSKRGYNVNLQLDNLNRSSNQQLSEIQRNEKPEKIKYKADEYALAYIFDLYAQDNRVPINRIEGSYDAKQIKKDSSLFTSYDKTPDGFYRAVKKVLKYDLNKLNDLQNISKDWYNAVKALSNNWAKTNQYLNEKGLIEE